MTREDILNSLPLSDWLQERGVVLTHGGKRANRCPLKQHSRPDAVSVDTEKQVWHCHACNNGGTVIDWLVYEKSITAAEAFNELAGQVGRNPDSGLKARIVATYDYTDEAGKLLFQCVRYEPKTFKQRQPDGRGGWHWNLKGVRLVPYRYPDLIKKDEVWVVEGEKDADSLVDLGFAATCNPMGAGKWRADYAELLRGKRVVIIPDNDDPGRKHAEAVAQSLQEIAVSIKVVTLPESVDGALVKDGTDFIGTFKDRTEAVERLSQMAEGAPERKPSMQEESNASPKAGNQPVAARAVVEFCTPSKLRNYIPPEGSVLVGQNHIVRGAVFVIGGAPGVGKSRAGIAMAVAGATGANWFDLQIHRRFRTLVLQTENGRLRLRDEFAAMQCDKLDEWIHVTPPPECGLSFERADFAAAVREEVASFKPDVVLLDPWNACARDEKARDYLETFQLIRSVLPGGDDAPAIGIVAHTRKPKSEERTTGRGLLNLLSGSYVLASVPRCVWVIQAATNDTEDNRVIWTCCKNSDGEMGKASAWHRRNGLFDECTDFDWDAFYDGAGGAARQIVSESDVAAMFANGRVMLKKLAVEELMERTGCCKSAAYSALGTDDHRKYRQLQKRDDGLLCWEDE